MCSYWEKIDLAIEIISPDDPERDLIDKRTDYATAGVSEYWIIDPRDDSIILLGLRAGSYQVLNQAWQGNLASELLPGFQVDIEQLFAQASSL